MINYDALWQNHGSLSMLKQIFIDDNNGWKQLRYRTYSRKGGGTPRPLQCVPLHQKARSHAASPAKYRNPRSIFFYQRILGPMWIDKWGDDQYFPIGIEVPRMGLIPLFSADRSTKPKPQPSNSTTPSSQPPSSQPLSQVGYSTLKSESHVGW